MAGTRVQARKNAKSEANNCGTEQIIALHVGRERASLC
jgi:hypothetical protein